MQSFFNRLGGKIVYWISQMAHYTCRFNIKGQENFEELLKDGQAFLIACWHGHPMMTISFVLRYWDSSKFMIIVPEDWRGEGLEVLARSLKGTPFMMDLTGDSTMGSARQLVKMVRHIQNGNSVFINPDGPSGPAYKIKPGVAFMAKKGKVPIMPVGAYCRNSFKLNRWDQYVIPMPFSRITIQAGEALTVPEDAEDLEMYTEGLTNRLHRANAQAIINYYELPRK